MHVFTVAKHLHQATSTDRQRREQRARGRAVEKKAGCGDSGTYTKTTSVFTTTATTPPALDQIGACAFAARSLPSLKQLSTTNIPTNSLAVLPTHFSVSTDWRVSKVHQQAHNRRMTVVGWLRKAGDALLVLNVEFGAGVDQHLGNVDVALVGGPHQWRQCVPFLSSRRTAMASLLAAVVRASSGFRPGFRLAHSRSATCAVLRCHTCCCCGCCWLCWNGWTCTI